MTKTIYMLIGIPGVGKSTWIEKFFQDECFVVSTDNIIQEIADETNSTYDDVFSKYIKVADRMMWESFDKFIEGLYNPIIIDRTNLSIKSRSKFFDRLNK